MAIPFYTIAPTTTTVQSPAFLTERQHIILAVDNALIPTSVPFLTFTSASEYASSFGQDNVYSALVKYFSFIAKSGTSAEKAVIVRWFKATTAPFVEGTSLTTSTALATLQEIINGSLNITFNGSEYAVTGLDFSGATSLSGCATILETAIQANTDGGNIFTSATVVYNSTINAFVITGGDTGADATVGEVTGDEDTLAALGFTNAILSQGVDAESFATFCDRVRDANPAGFTITTLESLTNAEMLEACAWLQQVFEEQTLYTRFKLCFNFTDLTAMTEFSDAIKANGYNGIAFTYDPKGELVNILDCAITASTNYEAENATKNYNFQPATGYTSIIDYGTITSYQDGVTNVGMYNSLIALGANFVYSVGYGEQEQTYYGIGTMLNDFRTEDIQANQAALETDLQVATINALDAVEKIKLRGTDADEMIATIINPSFVKYQNNGAIARNGTLSNTDRISITNQFGDVGAADSVEQNGYFYRVETLTDADTASRRRRVRYAYLAGGAVNKVVFNAIIYGV